MNTRSLRFQLTVWYAGALTSVFVLFGVFVYLDLKRYLIGDLHDRLFRSDWLISQRLLSQVHQTGEQYVIDEINARYAPTAFDRFVRITRRDGTVMYASGVPEDSTFDPTHLPRVQLPVAGVQARIEPMPGGKELFIVAVPSGPPIPNEFVVESGAPMGPIRVVLDELLLALALGVPLVLIVAIGGGYVLVRRALAPVDQMARGAEQITMHSLSDRLPVSETGDELEQLSRSLNHMITRLDESFWQTRRFIADASHELRTPLTIMRGELENAVQEPQLPAPLRETLGNVLEEVERLAKIVESLFALSRLDAGEAQAECVQFDLAELARTTTEQICLLAEDKGVSVTCRAPRAVFVQGDRARLKQVVVNLLDNAIKYTPQGGAVQLTVGISNGNAILEVADNGIGIPADALPHVFERFFRVDKARSREMGGAGIGLSIVKAICAAHRGRVEVQSTENTGSRFKVILPVATSTAAERSAPILHHHET